MNINILIGGAAGQGINKVSDIVSNVLSKYGYYTFNYRDYPSLIRGGHNFNVLAISDIPIESHSLKMDFIVALDERTIETHKSELKKGGVLVTSEGFEDEGKNLNVALAGFLIKILGIPLKNLESEINSQFKESEDALISAKKGFDKAEKKFSLKKLNNKISILSGSEAVSIGARNSSLDVYIAYPMTPSTNVMNEMAKNQVENNLMVFQPENEIAGVSMALGSSFAGAKTMVGTSGGGFDLMGESLSMQGISGIPLTVYLASRPGPGTGVPTYTSQSDLDIALRAGHGEFPRIVIAPGNPIEAIEKTSEALLLSEKFRTLSIILSDKHLAESEFSSDEKLKKVERFSVVRDVPGEKIVKAASYEVDGTGNSTEDAVLTEKNADLRVEKYESLKEYIVKNMEMIKIHGNKDSKNLIIGWGSTSGAIKDAIKDLDAKFLQVMYMKPLSPQIKEEMENAEHIILVECNVTGQLGRLLREKTGIKIENRLLKYDGRPFCVDELKEHLKEML
ncbi:MAG: 2-oxoacid:acceptor oxidoreductase family protein [archaeon]|nr:2-oxoacid:acceptor oxidoreductase family protein [archaeon]MCR4323713.1 2-oxoacid:acceptor oxidoreductase family protein [Nanoarchaeota archaeon]